MLVRVKDVMESLEGRLDSSIQCQVQPHCVFRVDHVKPAHGSRSPRGHSLAFCRYHTINNIMSAQGVVRPSQSSEPSSKRQTTGSEKRSERLGRARLSRRSDSPSRRSRSRSRERSSYSRRHDRSRDTSREYTNRESRDSNREPRDYNHRAEESSRSGRGHQSSRKRDRDSDSRHGGGKERRLDMREDRSGRDDRGKDRLESYNGAGRSRGRKRRKQRSASASSSSEHLLDLEEVGVKTLDVDDIL